MTCLAVQFAAFPRGRWVEDGAVVGPPSLVRTVGEASGMDEQAGQADVWWEQNWEKQGGRHFKMERVVHRPVLQKHIFRRTRISETSGLADWGCQL